MKRSAAAALGVVGTFVNTLWGSVVINILIVTGKWVQFATWQKLTRIFLEKKRRWVCCFRGHMCIYIYENLKSGAFEIGWDHLPLRHSKAENAEIRNTRHASISWDFQRPKIGKDNGPPKERLPNNWPKQETVGNSWSSWSLIFQTLPW